ncbi:uncharacterized protein LAESUDRAFT_383391 [Laetiporus sulphureus 93-53]|uniref:Uncharacterized protein n=1 Tax=Laetiporus sulphureus 93-53 TaxID=1314785 RepID=A0A165CMB3_9APHY|nr:uncharacterized protein LAESUDRAFT_383391 [Laetiporus sulphureus 93-53]KZT03066.1 hypothetical protein LAESUDRAFT_383391 [Laetiporus sulphureus 93-53]
MQTVGTYLALCPRRRLLHWQGQIAARRRRGCWPLCLPLRRVVAASPIVQLRAAICTLRLPSLSWCGADITFSPTLQPFKWHQYTALTASGPCSQLPARSDVQVLALRRNPSRWLRLERSNITALDEVRPMKLRLDTIQWCAIPGSTVVGSWASILRRFFALGPTFPASVILLPAGESRVQSSRRGHRYGALWFTSPGLFKNSLTLYNFRDWSGLSKTRLERDDYHSGPCSRAGKGPPSILSFSGPQIHASTTSRRLIWHPMRWVPCAMISGIGGQVREGMTERAAGKRCVYDDKSIPWCLAVLRY